MPQHPLENPSLAPYGYVFPWAKARLEHRSPFGLGINRECIIGRMWAKANREKVPGPLPIESIIHEILPGFAQLNRYETGDFVFRGRPYFRRDILILSSTMQWLGTNCGDCFLHHHAIYMGEKLNCHYPKYPKAREFTLKLESYKEEHQMELSVLTTHLCNDKCTEIKRLGGGCHYDIHSVSRRDQFVVHRLMFWLGTNTGRAFIEKYTKRIQTLTDVKRKAHGQLRMCA